MAAELTKQKVYEILSKGRSIPDGEWVRHTREHSLRTVYHMCEALRVSQGRIMSFRELHDIFRENLRASGLPSPPDGFNPVDHISALWTICEESKGTKLVGDFVPEITELLQRTPENRKNNSQFTYRIRFKYYDNVTKALDELDGATLHDTNGSAGAVPVLNITPPSSSPAAQVAKDPKSGREPAQSNAHFEAQPFRFSEKELEDVSRIYWDSERPLRSLDDARERVQRQIVIRRGQQDFRAALIKAYGGRCAVTAYDAVVALEAAHLIPFNGDQTNQVANGLLLRGDIHTLLDLNLIGFHPDSLEVHVAALLINTSYRSLKGSILRQPPIRDQRPARNALQWRWELFLEADETQ